MSFFENDLSLFKNDGSFLKNDLSFVFPKQWGLVRERHQDDARATITISLRHAPPTQSRPRGRSPPLGYIISPGKAASVETNEKVIRSKKELHGAL